MLISVAVLIPCFWQSRIQAGDLGSHVYNAWLATQIKQGKLPGLSIATQWHNILFDVSLTWLLEHFGAGWAQRIAVSAAVLIFFWGAFAFVSAVTRRSAWFVLPILAVLSYGYVFEVGMFNFYISLGLCFWCLAIFWNSKSRRLILIAPLLALAWLAHLLPVLWVIGIGLYLLLGRQLPVKTRPTLLLAGIAALVAIRLFISHRAQQEWMLSQMFTITGADQVFLFDRKYLVVLAAVLVLWAALFRRMRQVTGLLPESLSMVGQITVLTALGFLILPNRVRFGPFVGGISYIGERMSLATATLIVAFLAMVPAKRWHAIAGLLTAAVFFGFLFVDDRSANRLEDRLTTIVNQLPAGQKVIFAPAPRAVRIESFTHLLERACIGRCYAYADYEPASHEFRVRVNGLTPYVVPTYADSYSMQMGTYVVQRRDLPVYAITQCAPHDPNYCIRSLHEGEVVDPYHSRSAMH